MFIRRSRGNVPSYSIETDKYKVLVLRFSWFKKCNSLGLLGMLDEVEEDVTLLGC